MNQIIGTCSICGGTVTTAAELRRLHDVNQELLEALKAIAAPNALNSDHRVEACREALREVAKAAIAKAEGESK